MTSTEEQQPPEMPVSDEGASKPPLGRENSAGRRSILSQTSERYDVTGKGFLTPAERKMRNMDTEKRGYLNNAQVAQIVEQTMDIREHNLKLRNWVMALIATVVILALANLGTALAAARLAKDTEVNESTGELYVKGDSSVIITTQGRGLSIALDLYPGLNPDSVLMQGEDPAYAGRTFVCLMTSQLSQLFVYNQDSKDVALILQSDVGGTDEEIFVMGLDRSGASFNSTHVILTSIPLHTSNISTVSNVTFDFDSNVCENYLMGKGRRHLEYEDEEPHSRNSRYQSFLNHYYKNMDPTNTKKEQGSRKLSGSGVVTGFTG